MDFWSFQTESQSNRRVTAPAFTHTRRNRAINRLCGRKHDTFKRLYEEKYKEGKSELVCIGEATGLLQEYCNFKVIGIVGDLLSFK